MIKIAVVGHTNTGKTSLLRTLLHDSEFGEVSSRPSTTRDVVAAELLLHGQPVIQLFDTPGLEDGIGLDELLQQQLQAQPQLRHDEPAQIQRFLATPAAANEFEQEAKVLRQVLASDAALYLIDSRDPVLPKHQDELAVLRRCGKPLLPVLNFTAAANAQVTAWQAALAKVNLHAWVAFDTVSLPEQGESELFSHLSTLLPGARSILPQLLAVREQARKFVLAGAKRCVAELLLDVAAYREVLSSASDQANVLLHMQQQVRRREQAALMELLTLYGFSANSANLPELDIAAGRWQQDLFAADTFKAFGVKTSKGVAAGGAAGASVDLLFAGTTLGAGTLVGALAGGAYQAWQQYGRALRHKVQGYSELFVEEPVLLLLAARCNALLQGLARRGHAAVEPLHIHTEKNTTKAPPEWQKFMQMARQNPQWSSLQPTEFNNNSARQRCIQLLLNATGEN